MDERTPQELMHEVRSAQAEVARDVQELQGKAEGALKELPRAAKRTGFALTFGVVATVSAAVVASMLTRSHAPRRRAIRVPKERKRTFWAGVRDTLIVLGVVRAAKFVRSSRKSPSHCG